MYTKLKMSRLQPGEHTPKEIEITLPWDAGADDCVHAFTTAMRGLSHKSTVEIAIRDYIDEIGADTETSYDDSYHPNDRLDDGWNENDMINYWP